MTPPQTERFTRRRSPAHGFNVLSLSLIAGGLLFNVNLTMQFFSISASAPKAVVAVSGAGAVVVVVSGTWRMVSAIMPTDDESAPSEPGTWLTATAVRLVGSRRRHLLQEWQAHLAGAPEEGVVLTPGERRRYAAGFVLSALRMRLHDIAHPLWRPVDWLLTKDSRTNGFIAAVVGAQAIYIVGDGGIPALVAEVWEPCGILGAGLYVLARWLRGLRGIELAKVPPPSSSEE